MRTISILLIAAFVPSPGTAQGGTNVLRAEYIKVMDQEFGKMDGDKNGKVTRAEVEAFQRQAAVAQAGARARALFTRLDTDKSGQLSLAEFAKGVSSSGPIDGRPVLSQLDLNRDGSISLIEHRAGKLAYFDKIDLDKDGVVSAAEMKSAGVK